MWPIPIARLQKNIGRTRTLIMFQSFTDKSQGKLSAKRTDALRQELKSRNLDGFVVPRADEHQGEYVGPHAERLAWLTGFTGSAGAAVVLHHKAAIFVDGRYTVQAEEQTDGAVYEQCHLINEPVTKWLSAQLSAGQKLGYDPWLHTVNGVKQLQRACAKADAELVAVESNPIDAVWSDQPARPAAPVYAHPTQFAGQSSAEKAVVLSDALKTAGADAAVLTVPESIAWAFNLRGSDVPHTPICLAFAILRQKGPSQIYIDKSRLDEDLVRQLDGLAEIRAPEAFETDLGGFSGQKVLIDPAWSAGAIEAALKAGGAQIVSGSDPCLLPKAVKNPVEQEGARIAHVRDGAAMVKFLHWLEREAPSGTITEIDAAKKLEAFRADTGMLKEISFDSISGAGEHAALPHYRVNEASNLALAPGTLYLIDSGAQYQDGTTDITRTVAVGTPTEEMRDRYTRVLKGHIAIATARFPKGTNGAQLDTLARLSLWEAGLDFDHGTGHGVGSFLSVHEGPQRIAKTGSVALEPGMIISNEPGYYKQGAFGIRIENLVIVSETPRGDGEEREMYAFETITFCPIDTSVIHVPLLSDAEMEWLNAYHAEVRSKLASELEGADHAWLLSATEPVMR